MASAVIIIIKGEINLTEKGKYNGTTVKTAEKTYISSDSIYFIGKTDKYIFFFEPKKKSTQIIPIESVKEILLVTNNSD